MTEEHESQPTDRFYYADGKKIPLTPSQHFVAVRTTGPGEVLGRAATSLSETLTPSIGPGHVFDLPEYDLLIIETPGGAVPAGVLGAAPSATEAVRSFVDAQPGLAPGPEVYATPESPPKEGLIVVGEILMKFKSGVAEEARRKLFDRHNVAVRQADYPEPDAYLLAVSGNQDAIEVANRLYESDLVEYAHPNFVRLMPRLDAGNAQGSGAAFMESSTLVSEPQTTSLAEPGLTAPITPAAPPSDPGFSSQWGLVKIKAPEAFDISMGNPGISIAIIDEGCNLAHEDLAYKLPGYDAVTRTDNQEPQSADGHGTACAGIAAALANNSLGGAGVAPKCKVVPIRIARGTPQGGWFTSDAMIADGIRTAVQRGADVLSNSWGGGSPSSAISNAFRYAQTNGRGGKGCPIAIATGNGDVRGVSYPANLSPTIPGLLAVGASNEWDQRKSKTSRDGEYWWGSNYGPEVDVVAPGVHIYTTDIMGTAGYSGGNYVPNFNGTSSATPHVAGLMGLLLSVDPDLRSWEVEDIIKLTADELGTPGRDEEFGFGRINCRRALEAASRIWYEIRITPEFLGRGQECYMRVNVRMYNPGINSVRLDELTLTSHTSDWTSEIDRFVYLPNPGGVMAPRSGNDVRLNGILLKANGNRSSWSYRWSLNWRHTFWRPSAPGAPLAAGTAVLESEGRAVRSDPVRGGASIPQPALVTLEPGGGVSMPVSRDAVDTGDSITVDRQTKTITIVIR